MEMTAELLKGKDIAASLQGKLRSEVEKIQSAFGEVPRLLVLKAQAEHASEVYLKSQQKAAEAVGIRYEMRSVDPQKGEDHFHFF